MKLYHADERGNARNRLYPHCVEVKSANDLKRVAMYDHVFAAYVDGRRQSDRFICADALGVDVDNEHSDSPKDWVNAEDITRFFSDVTFGIYYSRNHMKVKEGKSPRPRMHIVFAIDQITKPDDYKALMKRLHVSFPYLDTNAMDAARFFFGTENPKVEFHPGSRTLTEFLADVLTEEESKEAFSRMCENGPQIQQGSRNATMSHFAGRVLKRFGNIDYAYSAFLQRATACNPPLDDEELSKIWHSARRFFSKVKIQEGYITPEKYNAPEGWDEPIPFSRFSVSPFPVEVLPEAYRDYALALAESTQTPVDMAGVTILSVLATCCQGKYKIRGKADWVEPMNLYLLSIAKPSERKSTVQKAAVKPINAYEIEQNRINAPMIESNKMRKRVLERKQKSIEDEVAKGKAEMDAMEAIAREIAEFREIRPLQLCADDITTEKLVAVLAENNSRCSLISSEGGIFDTLAGLYSRNVNIDVFLKAYSGDPIRVDRIGRDSQLVLDPALTVMLMAQPSVISDVLSNKTFRGRGLVARFLFSNPEEFVGHRVYRSVPMSNEVYRRYEQSVFELLSDDSEDIITLSPEADTLLEQFADEIESKINTEYEEISDWVGKLVGNVLRIAGLLGRAEVARHCELLEDPKPVVVSEQTMQGAIRLGRYFLNHAQNVFSVIPENSTVNNAERVLTMILENNLDTFNRREAMRNLRVFKKVEDIQPILDFLEDYGYIHQKEEPIMFTKGRPPLPKYDVHPALGTYFCPSVT